jgi:hypothetical protein
MDDFNTRSNSVMYTYYLMLGWYHQKYYMVDLKGQNFDAEISWWKLTREIEEEMQGRYLDGFSIDKLVMKIWSGWNSLRIVFSDGL